MADSGKKKLPTPYIAFLGILIFVGGILFGNLISGSGQGSSPERAIVQSGAQGGSGHSPELESQLAQIRAEIARSPQEPLNWIHLGNAYFDSGHFEEAVPAYSKALELNPANADVLTDLGTSYRSLGQYQEALEAYNKALGFNPTHQNAMFNSGVVRLFDLENAAGALQSWNALLAIYPQARFGSSSESLAQALDHILLDAAGLFLSRNHPESALNTLDQALLRNPANQAALSAKAQLLESQNRQTEAYALWRKLYQINPDFSFPDGRKLAEIINN